MVVRLPCNERVGGSIPSIGSIASVGVMANRHIRNVVFPVQVWAGAPNAAVAQLVVHFHGKEKVMGSFPIGGSKFTLWFLVIGSQTPMKTNPNNLLTTECLGNNPRSDHSFVSVLYGV